MNARVLTLALGALLLLGGCKGVGDWFGDPKALDFLPGITEADDVERELGPPDNRTQDAEGRDVWTYRRTAKAAESDLPFLRAFQAGLKTARDRDHRDKILVLRFDASGILDDISSRYSSF